MALSTFSELKTAIASLIDRTDFTSYIPDFITLAEAELNRRLQSRLKVTRADFTIDSEFKSVPTDFAGVVAFRLSSTDPDTELDYISPSEAARLIGGTYNDSGGHPRCYTIVGGEFQFVPAPDGTYTAKLTYRQKIPALSDSQTANWVLTDHPDLYLYGSAIHAAPFIIEDERIASWGALHERAIQSLERKDSIENYSGQLNARPRRVLG